MKLIKLTSPELIEDFFQGEKSIEVSEPCKVAYLDKDGDHVQTISHWGASVSLNGGIISVEVPEAPGEKKSKKK